MLLLPAAGLGDRERRAARRGECGDEKARDRQQREGEREQKEGRTEPPLQLTATRWL